MLLFLFNLYCKKAQVIKSSTAKGLALLIWLRKESLRFLMFTEGVLVFYLSLDIQACSLGMKRERGGEGERERVWREEERKNNRGRKECLKGKIYRESGPLYIKETKKIKIKGLWSEGNCICLLVMWWTCGWCTRSDSQKSYLAEKKNHHHHQWR